MTAEGVARSFAKVMAEGTKLVPRVTIGSLASRHFLPCKTLRDFFATANGGSRSEL